MANGELAQIIKAKGPNTTINAVYASTSQAIAMAEDWIRQLQILSNGMRS